MNNTDEDALAELRKHFRTVSFTPATEFINIDLKNEPQSNEQLPFDKNVRKSVRIKLLLFLFSSIVAGNELFYYSKALMCIILITLLNFYNFEM